MLSSSCVSGQSLLCPNQQEALQGMGHLDGFTPFPDVDSLNFRQVARPNPKNNLPSSNVIRTRPFEKRREFAERPRTDIIQRSHFLVQLLITPDENLGILKSKLTNHFRQKSCLLKVGFHQENAQVWSNNLQG